MDRTTIQKIDKETEDLNNIINQWNLIGIYRTWHPTLEIYTFYSSAHETFSRIHYIESSKTTSTYLKALKLYKICSQTTIGWN